MRFVYSSTFANIVILAATCSCITSSSGLLDVDECVTGSHNCTSDKDCSNTVGSFTCACRAGYTEEGQLCTSVIPATIWIYVGVGVGVVFIVSIIVLVLILLKRCAITTTAPEKVELSMERSKSYSVKSAESRATRLCSTQSQVLENAIIPSAVPDDLTNTKDRVYDTAFGEYVAGVDNTNPYSLCEGETDKASKPGSNGYLPSDPSVKNATVDNQGYSQTSNPSNEGNDRIESDSMSIGPVTSPSQEAATDNNERKSIYKVPKKLVTSDTSDGTYVEVPPLLRKPEQNEVSEPLKQGQNVSQTVHHVSQTAHWSPGLPYLGESSQTSSTDDLQRDKSKEIQATRRCISGSASSWNAFSQSNQLPDGPGGQAAGTTKSTQTRSKSAWLSESCSQQGSEPVYTPNPYTSLLDKENSPSRGAGASSAPLPPGMDLHDYCDRLCDAASPTGEYSAATNQSAAPDILTRTEDSVYDTADGVYVAAEVDHTNPYSLCDEKTGKDSKSTPHVSLLSHPFVKNDLVENSAYSHTSSPTQPPEENNRIPSGGMSVGSVKLQSEETATHNDKSKSIYKVPKKLVTSMTSDGPNVELPPPLRTSEQNEINEQDEGISQNIYSSAERIGDQNGDLTKNDETYASTEIREPTYDSLSSNSVVPEVDPPVID